MFPRTKHCCFKRSRMPNHLFPCPPRQSTHSGTMAFTTTLPRTLYWIRPLRPDQRHPLCVQLSRSLMVRQSFTSRHCKFHRQWVSSVQESSSLAMVHWTHFEVSIPQAACVAPNGYMNQSQAGVIWQRDRDCSEEQDAIASSVGTHRPRERAHVLELVQLESAGMVLH